MAIFMDEDSRAKEQDHRCDDIEDVQNKHI